MHTDDTTGTQKGASDETVAILLSLYNGQEFLEDLLDSLLGQTYTYWIVLYKDDGSSDRTVQIMERYRTEHPEKFLPVQGCSTGLGASRSFSELMIAASRFGYEYMMFCDQDDVWLKDKILKCVVAMKEAEDSDCEEVPILVHSDLKVVDRSLNTISDSLWSYQNLDVSRGRFADLLVQNCITGCAVMVNSYLVNRALPIPDFAVMHDWWLGLVASTFGKIVMVCEPTILYRQHGANDVGAKSYTLLTALKKVRSLQSNVQSLRKVYLQTHCFYRQFENMMNSESLSTIKDFLILFDASALRRLRVLLTFRFRKRGLARTVGMYWIVMVHRNSIFLRGDVHEI